MNRCALFLASLTLLALAGAEARGHFLFIHIGPLAEAGRAAEVYFSERAEAGDPRFTDKIAHTQLWLQTTPGQFQPLKVRAGADRLRAHLPSSGSVVVTGICQYGVIARAKQVPFLLRYYPKAMAGNPDELNQLKPFDKVPLEIVGTVLGDHVRLVALRQGKPVPKAEFDTVAADLSNEKLIADAEGRATWKPSAPGRYSVYTRYTTTEAGELEGEKYEEIREFATLAFVWPLEAKGSDPKAVALFEEAIAARAQWKDFPGFSAHIRGQVDGRSFDGTVTVDGNGAVALKTDEKTGRRWVREQLESIAMHRGAGSTAASTDKPKPSLHFADHGDDHPLGRLLVFEGGQFASSYRVQDQQLTVVNRNLGRQNMTITVLDNDRNADGRFLPRSYTVQYWDATTGDLTRTETVQERWQRIGAWDLPTVHTMTSASEAGLTVRSFTLSKHELLKVK